MGKSILVKKIFVSIISLFALTFSVLTFAGCSGQLNELSNPNGLDPFDFKNQTVKAFIYNETSKRFTWNKMDDAASYNIYTDITKYSSSYNSTTIYELAKSGISDTFWATDLSNLKWYSLTQSTSSLNRTVTKSYTYRFYIVGVAENGQVSKKCDYITVKREVTTKY